MVFLLVKFHFNSTSKYVNATGNVKFRTATPDGFSMSLFDLYMDVGILIKQDYLNEKYCNKLKLRPPLINKAHLIFSTHIE
uniref:Uncharacterized protein n=1 Tax=Strongyloides venezuelensis TaxID=75913 RepID=A0A0K0EVQ0_STRVS